MVQRMTGVSIDNKKNKTSANRSNSNSFRRKDNGVLYNELAQELVQMGFDVQTLMNLVKVNSFYSTDEALNLLSKDPDTGKYGHKYYQPNKITKL